MPKSPKSQKPSKDQPLWKGPCSSAPNGGITQSMIGDWLVCRERFRIKYILGLQPADAFNHRIEYGSMWHACEEELAKCKLGTKATGWVRALNLYAKSLCQRYKTQQEQVQHWYNVVRVAFPAYVKYWAKHKDVQQRTPLLQEQVFCVPYELPSGRKVYLRGKWDSVDLIGKGKKAVILLQENKSKGDIIEEQLKRQLSSGFQLQTMTYLVALQRSKEYINEKTGAMLAGVLYNVIRRPLSGGRHSIRQTQKETPGEFYERLGKLIAEEPEYFFMRWRVEIRDSDIARFRQQCLDPILEQMCDWHEWISTGPADPFSSSWQRGDSSHGLHFRFPYGVYSSLLEGREAEVDEYLNTGSTLGLEKAESLFGELKED